MTAAPQPVLDLLGEWPAAVGEQAIRLRAWLRGRYPELDERVYRGWQALGYHHPEAGYVCGIFPREERVQFLFEHGASLPDPRGLLEGDGRQVRYVPMRPGAAIDNEAFAELVDEAIVHGLG